MNDTTVEAPLAASSLQLPAPPSGHEMKVPNDMNSTLSI